MNQEETISIELPTYITYRGYGHMGNKKIFRLSFPLIPNSNGIYHFCYGNAHDSVLDIYAGSKNEGIKKLKDIMSEDTYWKESSKEEWLKENEPDNYLFD